MVENTKKFDKDKEEKDITQSSRYCIFEKKICRYARKKGPMWCCEAPSDYEMPCWK